MSSAHATINAGVCGFITEVTACADDDMQVVFTIETPCETIRTLAQALPTVDALSEISAGFGGSVHKSAQAVLKGCCSGCVVPSGVFKAMQVAAGLALPRDAGFVLTRAEANA